MRRHQQGIALIGLLALLTLGASYWLVSALATPANRTASDREHNAKVLNEAKQALIGRVGIMVLEAGEANPGRLPCPEAPGSANNVPEADDGVAAGNCVLPAVGRLPWRTLGINKLTDASGEPLWYVVSPAWAFPGAGNTIINSNTAGQLTLDAMGDVVALIIAPGRPLNIQAGGGCVARNQARVRVIGVNWDARDFLDCTNSDGDAVFATNGPADSFNDQVLAVTAGDVLPVIESAVATRFVRDFGAQMRYCDGLWPACMGGAVYYPFAAPFGDPATANYQGQVNRRQGLPPISFSGTGPCTVAGVYCNPPAACNPALDNRCAPALVTYRNNPVITQTAGGGATLQNYNCSVAGTPSTLTCNMNASHSIFTAAANRWFNFTMEVTSDNVGMALRDINAQVQMTGVDTAAINPPFGYSMTSASMNADGSATVRLNARVTTGGGGFLGGILDALCGLLGFLGLFNDCNQHTVTLPFMWVDEPMLYANNATMDWWYRNGWHQLTYYAVSQDNAPNGDGTCAGATCLTVTGGGAATSTDRAIVVMPGRALAGQDRTPPTLVSTWLEAGNAAVDDSFWGRGSAATTVNRSFNDHVVTIGRN
jgi:hypothetical protein